MASRICVGVDNNLSPNHMRSGWIFFDKCRCGGWTSDSANKNKLSTPKGDGDFLYLTFDSLLPMEALLLSPDDAKSYGATFGVGN